MELFTPGIFLRAVAVVWLSAASQFALAGDCPAPTKLPAVCMAVTNAQKDTSGKYDFHYQKLVYEAACSSPLDDDEDKGNQKIRRLWLENADRLVCNNSSFDVQSGNVLKYAVSARFEALLVDAALIWKVDLNRVDASDGRTVLDYTYDEISRNKGKSIESTLRSYYDMLRSAGAKRRSELKP